jgi:hypothetical protein
MTTFANDKAVPVKVAFKLEGKTYNNGTQEANAVDTAESTHYPFDEMVVPAGKTAELGNATIVATTDMTEFSAATQRSLTDFMEVDNKPRTGPDNKKTKEVSKAAEKSLEDYQAGNQAG